MEPLEVHHESVSDGGELCGDDREDGDINAVELVKASPRSTLTQPRQDLADGLPVTGKVSKYKYVQVSK